MGMFIGSDRSAYSFEKVWSEKKDVEHMVLLLEGLVSM